MFNSLNGPLSDLNEVEPFLDDLLPYSSMQPRFSLSPVMLYDPCRDP